MSTKADMSNMTFAEVEALYGEEAAIQVGIAADPDTFEGDEDFFRHARPMSEVDPELHERLQQTPRSRQSPSKERITICLDAVVVHLRATCKGWQTRINDLLHGRVFGSD